MGCHSSVSVVVVIVGRHMDESSSVVGRQTDEFWCSISIKYQIKSNKSAMLYCSDLV